MLAYPFSDHRDSVGSFPTHQGGIDLNVFEAVKQSVTTRQAAEHYGIRVGRNGMACCPFHNDKTPSMKLDRRYHCFGCGADGDVIDFTAALYGLRKKEVAVQLAQDFGISHEDWKPPGKVKKPKPRQKSPEEQFQEAPMDFTHIEYISSDKGNNQKNDKLKNAKVINGAEDLRNLNDLGIPILSPAPAAGSAAPPWCC